MRLNRRQVCHGFVPWWWCRSPACTGLSRKEMSTPACQQKSDTIRGIDRSRLVIESISKIGRSRRLALSYYFGNKGPFSSWLPQMVQARHGHVIPNPIKLGSSNNFQATSVRDRHPREWRPYHSSRPRALRGSMMTTSVSTLRWFWSAPTRVNWFHLNNLTTVCTRKRMSRHVAKEFLSRFPIQNIAISILRIRCSDLGGTPRRSQTGPIYVNNGTLIENVISCIKKSSI